MVNKSKPAENRSFALKHVDSLIVDLSAMCQCANDAKGPGLVELNRALKRAYKLRRLISNNRVTFQQWKPLLDSIVFVIEVTRKLYSLIINYVQNQMVKYEMWNNNKIVAYC